MKMIADACVQDLATKADMNQIQEELRTFNASMSKELAQKDLLNRTGSAGGLPRSPQTRNIQVGQTYVCPAYVC